MSGLSRYVVHRRVQAYRWERGEVVVSGKKLRDMYWGKGLSIREIADALFCSIGVIHKRMREEGIARRCHGGCRKKGINKS